MKIKLFCNKCEEPACAESNKIMVVVPHGKQYSIEITVKLLYEFSCENGHLNRFFITNPKYELLFDMGLCAYLNGFYREAVLDFAASLERFYENCINIFLIERYLNQNAYGEKIEQLWKPIKKQSERQYGAFLAMYMMTRGHLPELFPDKQTEFRNKVTHQGLLPNKDDTLKYAKEVAKYIVNIYNELTDGFTNVDKLNYLRRLETIQNMNQLKKERDEMGVPINVNLEGVPIFSFFRNHYSQENWFECMFEEFQKNCNNRYDI